MLRFFLAIILFVLPLSAKASVQKALEDKELVGQARFEKFFMDIYDVSLFAPGGSWEAGEPLALKLQYLRSINAARIASVSADEMRDLGFENDEKLLTWEEDMRRIFPDVEDGTTLIGVLRENGTTVFYHNGEPAGEIADPEFGQYFFGIWLSEATSEPELREQILGLKSN